MKKLTTPNLTASRLTGLIVSLSIACVVLPGCQKPGSPYPSGGHGVKEIRVTNLEQLYAAINDSTNKGKLLVLAPGTYTLDSNHVNAGRLELLEDMSLQGQTGHPERVIVDASALPGTSFTPPMNFPAARTGAIRMGRGTNTIQWLTVKGNASAQALSVIETDLVWPGGPQVRIANSIVSGGRIGIDIRNVGQPGIGRTLSAEIADNEITENLVQFGQGIEIQNANGAKKGIIQVYMHGNNVHGNLIGLRSFNNNANGNNTDSGSITIQSQGDSFDGNGVGIYLAAGLNQGSPSNTASGNFLDFEAKGTSIRNNLGAQSPDITDPAPGGLYLAGGLSVNGGQASNNILEIRLSDCPISDNQGPGIKAYGAFSALAASSPSTLAGINNSVQIRLDGSNRLTTLQTTASLPAEPAGTNLVKIIK